MLDASSSLYNDINNEESRLDVKEMLYSVEYQFLPKISQNMCVKYEIRDVIIFYNLNAFYRYLKFSIRSLFN